MRKNKETIIEIISCLFIALFIYTAVSKLIDYTKFRVEIGKSPLLTSFAPWVAIGIPVTEIIVAVLLSLKSWRLIALYASFTLMMTFTAYIIAILQFSEFIPCTCGGVLQNMTWNQHLVFNIVFILMALVGILLHPSTNSNNEVYHLA
ncbi:hypothetical protein WSM22_37600 [Cytophagales bacterium WSM2-2]|nr:hypothetical protein WSM22_37600 [Cytophagales bacterium WSM2-2]